jgi:hypothetical protein
MGGELHAPAVLSPVKEPAGTHWIGGWMGRLISRKMINIY